MSTVIYARQSLDKDGQGTAVERQLVECRALASSHGLTVSREFVDNDVSASKGVRPEFTKLISLIQTGDVETIIVWHTDRLYRRVIDLIEIIETAEKNALRMLTVKAGEIDLSNPAGRMYAGMLATAARYEVEQKGVRQVASNIQRAKKGSWQFSNRPYGYERVNGKVQIVEDEAAVIREAYERYLAGETYYAIADNFNVRSIPTTNGGPWTVSQLRARLANPAYAGIRLYRGEEVSEGDWEPLITRENWEQFKSAKQRRKTPHTWSNRTKYLLSGLALCGVCGGRMMARPDYPRPKNGVAQPAKIAYACTANWCVQRNQARVDELVESVIIARLSLPDASKLIRPKIDIQPMLAKSDELRQRRDDLALALAEGLLTIAAVREASGGLTKQIDALQRQISAADGDSKLVNLIQAEDVADHWRSKLTLAQRRGIIGTLTSITIKKQKNTRVFDPEDVAIEWLS
ncbi:Site-specific DNA recombinase [Agreia bicolorata]|uniref:Site-specific DNA recombinase n=1 Tax=Agreia bicolorata TaxID=110935 RepID=A0A1T4XBZ1_9MICO|nr:recombinase family protein [Agreia bicolorata]SKA86959.1 Site-specific DNA recombinase [Agreia bicolorata]